MLNAWQRVNFVFDGGRHKRCEPPRHHLGPEGWMYDVESFKILLVSETIPAIKFLRLINEFLMLITCRARCCKPPSASSATGNYLWMSKCESKQ